MPYMRVVYELCRWFWIFALQALWCFWSGGFEIRVEACSECFCGCGGLFLVSIVVPFFGEPKTIL